MHHRGRTAAILCLIVATACARPEGGARPTGSPTEPAATLGARGVIDVLVREGEQCQPPPVTPEPSCEPKPLEHVRVDALTSSGARVASAHSDAKGRARITVAAGAYTVRGERLDRYAVTPEQSVTVTAGATATVLLTYGQGFQ